MACEVTKDMGHINQGPCTTVIQMKIIHTTHTLTFKWLGWYLNFSTWYIKNVLFEQNELKLQHKQNFVKNRTDYAACLKNAVYILAAQIYKMNFEWCLVYVRSHANTGHLKVKTDYDCTLHDHLELIICIFIFKTTRIHKPCSNGDKIFFPSVSKFQNKSSEFAIFL
jgi:hypothetical protein